eukprot:COSAG06_NODE_10311_length_1705_cov_1.638854_1_plen_195_part_00
MPLFGKAPAPAPALPPSYAPVISELSASNNVTHLEAQLAAVQAERAAVQREQVLEVAIESVEVDTDDEADPELLAELTAMGWHEPSAPAPALLLARPTTAAHTLSVYANYACRIFVKKKRRGTKFTPQSKRSNGANVRWTKRSNGANVRWTNADVTLRRCASRKCGLKLGLPELGLRLSARPMSNRGKPKSSND